MHKNSLIVLRLFLSFSIILLSILTKAGRNNLLQNEVSEIEGRWDLTLYDSITELPSWLEIQRSGNNTLVGQFVGYWGSSRPISRINFGKDSISFSIPPQWENGTHDLLVEGRLADDKLTGIIILCDGKILKWSGVRAPALLRKSTPAWGKPITLFNGKDLHGWHTSGKINQWVAEEGVLRSPESGSNLLTDQSFTDFKLHIEFRYPKGSNSGVYLRGRYEVQIEDEDELFSKQLGSIYGFIAPSERIPKIPGTWQSYDITLIGRMVTLAVNGKIVICHQEIPGITGGAINSKEAEPGPFQLQGDHGPIEFRNIVITPGL